MRNAATCTVCLYGLLLFVFVHRAPAGALQNQEDWTLTNAGFQSRRVHLVKLGETSASVTEADGQLATLPLAELIRLERAGANTAPNPDETPFILYLRSGDRLLGTPVRLTDTGLVMHAPGLGEVEAPLEELQALARSQTSEPGAWRLAAPAADEIVLANGDQVRGYVAAIDGDSWTFADELGNETPLTAAAVRQVRFADPGVPAKPLEHGWRVRLANGSLIGAEGLSFTNDEFNVKYRGREAKLPASAVAWLEPIDGPVRWLADLPLAESVHTPYFGSGSGGLIQGTDEAGGRSFVVRSRSRLGFDIPAGYSRFRTRYALARGMTHGAVDVRILLDGKVVHERNALTAADATEPVEIALDGGSRLTLEVDYGPGLDVQDVVHWIDPALVRGDA